MACTPAYSSRISSLLRAAGSRRWYAPQSLYQHNNGPFLKGSPFFSLKRKESKETFCALSQSFVSLINLSYDDTQHIVKLYIRKTEFCGEVLFDTFSFKKKYVDQTKKRPPSRIGTERRLRARFTLLFHSGRPVSRPKRRALPRPLPDAPSPPPPGGPLAAGGGPLCPLSGGTLPVHRGFISIILPARPTCVKAGAVFFTARGSSPRAARLSKKADAFSAKEISLRSAPRSSAHGRRFDARSAQSVFRRTRRRKNDFIFFRRLRAAETLRGFFDTLTARGTAPRREQ